jgi:HAE1 family hydrophobic/amphiphilic exporter-1
MRVIGVIVATLLGAAPATAQQPLTRAAAVAEALRANPIVLRAREDMLGLEGRKREAIADALPSVTLVGSALRYRDPSLLNSPGFDSFPPDLRGLLTVAPANLYGGSAQFHQTLFTFRLGGAIRAARYGLAMGKEQARQTEQSVELAAIRAYNAYLLSLEQVRVAEQTQRQKEEHLAMARNRRQAGVATDLEVLRSEVDVENQRSQLLGARSQADLARGALNAVIVRPVDAPVEPADTLDYLPFEIALEDVIQEALANRPELKATRHMQKAYEQLIGVARADALPRLDLDGTWGYSVRELKNFGKSDFASWNASLRLTVPVFDGFRAAGRVAQAQAEARKIGQDRVAMEIQVRLEAKEAYERLSVARSILEAAELNVTQAQKAVDMTQANYKHGAATTLDVLDAQEALSLAASIRLGALHEHANARATVRYVMGRDPLDPPAARTAAKETPRNQ